MHEKARQSWDVGWFGRESKQKFERPRYGMRRRFSRVMHDHVCLLKFSSGSIPTYPLCDRFVIMIGLWSFCDRLWSFVIVCDRFVMEVTGLSHGHMWHQTKLFVTEIKKAGPAWGTNTLFCLCYLYTTTQNVLFCYFNVVRFGGAHRLPAGPR